ncbi:MAG: ComEC/Rec2 family competence protein [Deltaproteobacteria bacterium]|nr:ComEC/Rec2 family competence protein [Deltaproteobacteria bacterium]
MRELARELAYRPLFWSLLLVVWAIVGTVCFAFPSALVLLLSLLPFLLYYLLLRRLQVAVRPLFFIGLLLFSLLLAALISRRVTTCRRRFLAAEALLVQVGSEPQTIIGRVLAFPQGSPHGWRLRLQPLTGILAGGGLIALELPAVAYDDPRLPRIGDIIAATISLRPLSATRHPFLPGYRRLNLLSGLVAEARLEDFTGFCRVARFAGGLDAVERLRRFLYHALSAGAGAGDAAAILQAVLLGSRDHLRPAVKELFLDFGVFHLFAISGLHLSVVVGLFFFSLKRLLAGFLGGRLAAGALPLTAALTLLFLPLYILLAGLHLPVVRAGIMALFFLLALLSGRLRDSFSALAGAAIVILCWWPQALFELSFQLSFSAVAVILWVLPRARSWWERGLLPWCRRLPLGAQVFLRNVFYLLASSAAITLVTAPWLINQVHFISTFSLAANLLLLPLFSLIIIPAGMLSLLLAPWPGLMALFLKPLVWLLDSLLSVSFFLQEQLSGRRCYFSSLTSLEMLLAALFILLLLWFLTWPRYKKSALGIFCFLAVAVLLDQSWWVHEQGRKKLSFAAFVGGQPQSFLLEMPGGEALLINGGSWSGSATAGGAGAAGFSLAKNVIAPYCWRRKIKKIDTIVLTQPQRGLIGGLLFLIEHFQVREIWYHGVWSGYPPFSNFCRVSQDRFGVRWRKISSFSYPFFWEGVDISIIGPPANDFIFAPSRQGSLLGMAPSLLLEYGAFSALIWGGGQLDSRTLPVAVDLMALLIDPHEPLPEALCDVAISAGGWSLTPGSRRRPAVKLPQSWYQARAWQVKKDGFLFLEADFTGTIRHKLPPQLISGCQGGLE